MKFIFVPCRSKIYIDRKCYEIDLKNSVRLQDVLIFIHFTPLLV
jgi:hypothetical protein